MNKMMRTPEAASFLNIDQKTLEIWRFKGRGPKFYKVGRKIVVYALEDLEKYVKDHEIAIDISLYNGFVG